VVAAAVTAEEAIARVIAVIADGGYLHQLERFAATYAAGGEEMFPVNPRDKTPLVSQYTASSDAEVIAGWWKRWPGALIGRRVPPDHLELDIDPRHGGLETWEELERRLGPIRIGRMLFSGRGDGGFHAEFLRPDWLPRVSRRGLDQWALEHEVGHPVLDKTGRQVRWTSGIDPLTYTHRYTIWPPSPHPDTGHPYRWEINGALVLPPQGLAELLVPVGAAATDEGGVDSVDVDEGIPLRDFTHSDSIADWVSETWSWREILEPQGWKLVAGDGDSDGSLWRHPEATQSHSASVRHGCLFVYSPNTVFVETEPDEPHGYTRFAAWALLEHGGDQRDAARAARTQKDRQASTGASAGPSANSSTGGSLSGGGKAGADKQQMSKPRLTLVRASSVRIDRPTWVWDRRIPVGGTTLMAGREGLGKTLLVCHLAAVLSRGMLPGFCQGQPTDVIYVGIEDDRSTVLVPRLTAAGADLDRVHFVDFPKGGTFSLDVDAVELTELAKSVSAALVVVDPLDSHLGPIDSHKKAEVQASVARLAELAQDVRCGALGLGHFNKSAMRDVLRKVVGSVGFTTAVRSVLGVGENPQDVDERLCVLAKANVTDQKAVGAVRFRPEKVFLDHPDGGYIDTARAHVLGELHGIDPNSILVDPEERSATASCKEWLQGYLKDGKEKLKKDIEEDSTYTPKVLRNARVQLKLIVNRDEKAKGRPSTWRLPGHE